MDSPQSFKVVGVAGTNGKGSCAAMAGSILKTAGLAVGVYTSPHLVRFNERIRISGIEVDDAELCHAFEYIESTRGNVPLTYFEFATLAAIRLFHLAAVDIAVMEVGMGGRLDAVNAMDIDASLLTNVELDHMQWLGDTREAIGAEKAHIMRPGCVSVFNGIHPPVSVLQHALRIGTKLLVAGRDYGFRVEAGGWRWFGPRGENWQLELPSIPGAVQVENAAGVLALLTSSGLVKVHHETASRGLVNARIGARCQIVARDPLVVVDVAHNPSAMETLKRQLAANPVSGRTYAVFGILKDKNIESVVLSMNDEIDAWHVATIRDERGQEARVLADVIKLVTSGSTSCHDNAADAYEAARRRSGPNDRILVFGSFHIAGDILAHMKRPY